MTHPKAPHEAPAFAAQKQRLRAQMRQQRRSLDAESRARMDQSINRHVVELARECGARSVAAFWSFDGEPDLREALSGLAGGGCQLALPIVADRGTDPHIEFHSFTVTAPLRRNRFGIEEPEVGEAIDLATIDLVLVPLVAWDERGFRLGMGAGYYDRQLAPIEQSAKPCRVGVGYQLQRVDAVPIEPWDVPLHGVITELGRFTCTH